jgi:PAS domain S-box-containing protein
MTPPHNVLFHSDLWARALESYASDTGLSVKLFDANERVVIGPIHPTPLFQLFEERGFDPGIFGECAQRCLSQTGSRPAVLVSELYGLTVIGTSLLLEGQIVGAAVGGYAFVEFSQVSEIQRLARQAGIQFERVWQVAREQKPVSRHRLKLNGELLQVLGDSLLRENRRTQQYEDAVLQLQETVRAKEETHQALQQTVAALRESEERYRTLFNLGPVAVYSCDAAGVIQEFNRTAAELWGREPAPGDTDERFCGSSRLFRPDGTFMPHEQCPMSEVVSGKLSEVRDAEVLIERLDGSRITVVVNIRPVKNQRGELVGAINCFYDITERKRTERAAASLAAIVESSDDAIISRDLNGVITSWNAGAERLFGYTAQEAIGRPVTMLIPLANIDEETNILEHIRRGESIEHYETVRRRKDGKLLDISLTVSPIRDRQGRVIGASKIARDITEQKEVEKAIREAGERFRFMAESMPQKISTAKSSGEVDYINQQWMEYTGQAAGQIKDWGWTQFIHPDDKAENVRAWKQSIDTGDPFQFEHRLRHADGSYRWHLSRALPMRDSKGNVSMWIGSTTDIQAVRDQEERLLRTEKMAAAGQLAASMAHEINNPLSSVTNSLYLLENYANLNEEARLFASTAAAELARVTRIVKQSLSYYRVGTIPRDLDLGDIVNESLEIFREKFQRTGVELKARIDNESVLVGFPDELRQVIDNLLLNALEAMPGGGRLTVAVHQSFSWTRDRRHRKGVRLTISDTGCGIPKEYRWKIFEPFFTTKAEKGTGLGLWILQGIIAKHEGAMSMRSSDTKSHSGTVISIFLPSHARASHTSETSKVQSAA